MDEKEIIKLKKALVDSRNLFSSITCLRAEGVEFYPSNQILDAIEKEASRGYRICNDVISIDDEICTWILEEPGDDERWVTACGDAFWFEVEGIKENGFHYCPFCGKQIRHE